MLPFRSYFFRDPGRSGSPCVRPWMLASLVGSLLAGGVVEAAPVPTATVLLVPHPISGSTGPAYLAAKPTAAELAGLSFQHAFVGPGKTGWHPIPGPNGTVKGWKLAFALKGRYARLRTLAGVADGLHSGSARFRVVGDGKTLYTSPIKHSGDDPLNLDLNIAGVKDMALTISGTDAGAVPSLVIWADPTVYPVNSHLPAVPAWPKVATNQPPGTDPDAAGMIADAGNNDPSATSDETATSNRDAPADPSPDTSDPTPTDPATLDTSTDSSPDLPPIEAAPSYGSPDAPPDASVDSVFSWSEVPTNAPVPIVRAVFDQNGYQLFDDEGETIVIPFINHNLYAMKFGQSDTGSMYFINDGTAPILYVPQGGYLENATVAGARWYPFPRAFHPGTSVYLGPAASWSAFEEMCWYPDMVYRGGYWSETAWVGEDVFVETPGIVFIIDGDPCYGWGSYHRYLYRHSGYDYTREYRPVVYDYPREHGPGYGQEFHTHPGRRGTYPGDHSPYRGGGNPEHGGHPTHSGGNEPPPGGHHPGSGDPGTNHGPGHNGPGHSGTPGRIGGLGRFGGTGHTGGPVTRPGTENHPTPGGSGTPQGGNHSPEQGNGHLNPRDIFRHRQPDHSNPPAAPNQPNGPTLPQRNDNPPAHVFRDPSRPWLGGGERTPRQSQPSPPTLPRHEDSPEPRQPFRVPVRHEDPPAPRNDPPPFRREPEHHDNPPAPHHEDTPAPKHEDPPADKTKPSDDSHSSDDNKDKLNPFKRR